VRKRAELAGAGALAALALLSGAVPAGATTARQGVDVSRLEKRIDWPRVAGAGVDFAFVEASRGSGADCTVHRQRCGADPWYARNYREARAAGISVGPYERAFTGGSGAAGVRADALTEANLFCDRVGSLRKGDLLPVLDVEPPFGGLSGAPLRLWLRTWLARTGSRLGAQPMIYTSATGWAPTGDSREFARAGNRLWIANWGVASPAVPAGNWAGQGWSAWQYTNNRRVPGIAGLPDADVVHGSLGPITVLRPLARPER